MIHRAALLVFLSSAAVFAAAPARAQQVGRVCPDPAHPCAGFHAWDLSFVLPHDAVARADAESEAFFAVIVRSGLPCSITERERAAVQRRFPGRKVFVQRFECGGDAENNVSYAGASPVAFLAVYAGRTAGEGRRFLAWLQVNPAYRGAYLREMRVRYEYP